MNPSVDAVTDRIRKRSADSRRTYLERIDSAIAEGPGRAHLSCSNLAHAAAAAGPEQESIASGAAPNIGIVTAYNDMLSAHQPFERFPGLIREAARTAGATAQVAGGVPAMCDGVTQGRPGMELSLFSRDVIALSAAVALTHNCFDAAVFLGVCDKIVPGLAIAAASFGHLPSIFLPGGPMPSGLSNDRKSEIRNRFAAGEVGRDELLAAEMQAYHAPGTCTFYGTANSNQMLMEVMGLHLPGATFVNPNTLMRDALTVAGVHRVLQIAAKTNDFMPVGHILNEKAFVNGMVALNATGGSTNLVMHMTAMAAAAGIRLDMEDFADLSEVTPLMARVYPNGTADVNQFHAAGGLQFVIGELLGAGLMHDDVLTVAGPGLGRYTQEPKLDGDGAITWHPGPGASLEPAIVRPASDPFQEFGGLKLLDGNLGRSVIKVSAVAPERRVIEAPARIFHDQEAVKLAFAGGELDRDVVCVVRFQGPKANGMPELHGLTPTLGVIQERGHRVALVTDGRMSGASGKIPAAIHVAPEAADGGPIARLRDGDMVRLDATAGRLEVLAPDFEDRVPATADLSANDYGYGRDLFVNFRRLVGSTADGASVLAGQGPA